MADAPYKKIGKWIIVELQPNGLNQSRLGIVVTRRFGNAVKRNRFKRLVRESFRLSSPHFKSHYNIVVKSRSYALQADRDTIQQELIRLVHEVSNKKQDGQAYASG
jgi:ribonuclease P protein component